MPSKESIRKRVRRDKVGEEPVEAAPKKPRVEKEEKKGKVEEPPPVVIEKTSALDITQCWLVEKLTPENVSNLVLVSMVSRKFCLLCMQTNVGRSTVVYGIGHRMKHKH